MFLFCNIHCKLRADNVPRYSINGFKRIKCAVEWPPWYTIIVVDEHWTVKSRV